METVLFICVGNSDRSQMAEAFFNYLAKGEYKALSAGTNPAASVDPTVLNVMREVGIDISNNLPKALTPEMMDQADRVVTMGCGAEKLCPATWVQTEDWELGDPKGQTIERAREIRDEIKARVLKLLSQIDKHESKWAELNDKLLRSPKMNHTGKGKIIQNIQITYCVE